jgi:hypothetical protein
MIKMQIEPHSKQRTEHNEVQVRREFHKSQQANTVKGRRRKSSKYIKKSGERYTSTIF